MARYMAFRTRVVDPRFGGDLTPYVGRLGRKVAGLVFFIAYLIGRFTTLAAHPLAFFYLMSFDRRRRQISRIAIAENSFKLRVSGVVLASQNLTRSGNLF